MQLLHGGDAVLESLQLSQDEVGQLAGQLLVKVGLHLLHFRLQVSLGEIKQVVDIDVAQSTNVDRAGLWNAPKSRIHGNVLTVAPMQDPIEYADVFAKAGPDEVALVVDTEPVDVEDLWQLDAGSVLELAPVIHVAAHVVAEKWPHGKRIIE